MLLFTFGSPASFHLTLAERVTLDAPVYLLVFTPRTPGTAAPVAVVLSPEASTDRSDEFALDVDTVFADRTPGQYTYAVYEQAAGDNNTDPAAAGALLEQGLAVLRPETPFAFMQRATTTQFTQPTR